MIDTLSSDIEKEMAVAKTEEADAQMDYEETIKARTLGLLAGGNSNIFWNFHPDPQGDDFQFEVHIFQRGWVGSTTN